MWLKLGYNLLGFLNLFLGVIVGLFCVESIWWSVGVYWVFDCLIYELFVCLLVMFSCWCGGMSYEFIFLFDW